MKYLKRFIELVEESARPIYNKRDVIDFILTAVNLDDDEKDELRQDMAKMSEDEIDDKAKDMGLKKFGRGFWVAKL